MDPLNDTTFFIPFDNMPLRGAPRQRRIRSFAHHPPPPPPLGGLETSSDSDDDDVAATVAAGAKIGLEIKTPDESSPTELVQVDPAEVGMSVGLKHLYGGKEDKHGRFQWKTSLPKNLGKPAEDAESTKWAIIVRHVKAYNDPKKVLALHSIVVQSPLLKELLRDVLDGYPGVALGLKRLELSGRFEPLIHRWSQLTLAIEKLKAANDEDVPDRATRIEHAELLFDLVTDEFREVLDASADMQEQGVVSYEMLWTLFQPDGLVYNQQQGQDRVWRLRSSRYGVDRNGNPVYWLTCQYVDWDGSKWGTAQSSVCVPAFEGTLPIRSLMTFPLAYHAEADALRERLIARGERVEALAGSHYRAYAGVGWRPGSMGQKEIFSINGRVVIDTYGWNRFNPLFAVSLLPLQAMDSVSGVPGSGSDGSGCPPGSLHARPILYEGGYDHESGIPFDGMFASEDETGEAPSRKLTEEERLICSPLVRGYALKEKMWLNFFVNAVQDVTFFTDAFESLVLPDNQKELILGFIATQQSRITHFDDVVHGKGRGIILLLCGPPGVGKTLTAESVAEELRVPLYVMSAGDLGLDSRHIESKLQGILDMCTRWNAILLLDEADVFLEQRSLHELERNKLVSVFLRILEYYEGILFLTTNRVQTFDAAFQSRIHISLDYPELNEDSRKKVWQQFLAAHDAAQAAARENKPKTLPSAAKATPLSPSPPTSHSARSSDSASLSLQSVPTDSSRPTSPASRRMSDNMPRKSAAELAEQHRLQTLPHAITPLDLNRLARLPMNGRQIKNILKTAQLLAAHRGQGLGFEHVQAVMVMTQHLHQTNLESERTRASLFS